LLVVLVGEATKLSDLLMQGEKEYETEIVLGAETVTLDAEGDVTIRREVPILVLDHVQRATRRFLGTYTQQVPQVSAVKLRGRPLYARVRRGEQVDAPTREVQLHDVQVLNVSEERIHLRLRCGKGFYVRSFARDLAHELGTVGHVGSLRRTRVGGSAIVDAVPKDLWLDVVAAHPHVKDLLSQRVIPMSKVCLSLPQVMLSKLGCEDAFHGRAIPESRCLDGSWREEPEPQVLVLTNDAGELVALGRREGNILRVVRGIRANL
jgi:tRNA pseudouridine55 synthase